ncbi:MAG: NAD(P)-dependent oxidoreductase [Betaproteobacteria bacterium]|nr:NAD(P)-dependent oxidoreductase [Betaproteobacteria bacterium]
MNSKRVLLTGATGFIGRHCIPELLARGYEVHAVSSRPAGAIDGVQWHRADLHEGGETDALLEKVRATHLLHLAWYAVHGRYWQALENLDWVQASLRLLRAFVKHGGQRATFAGTCAEYDWTAGRCSEDTTPLRPQALYGVCKHALHLVLDEVSRQTGLGSAWGRVFFLYGPAEQPGRLVPSVICSLLRRQPVSCSTGEQMRDYLYVADVASAFVAVLDSALQGAVNIGSGTPFSVRQIVDRIVNKLGHSELVSFGRRESRQDEAALVLADVNRLATQARWSPRFSLDQGLDLTISWWREHLDVRG